MALLPSDEGNADARLAVTFYKRSVKQDRDSEEAGRPIFKEFDFVRICVPGDNLTEIDTYAQDSHKQRFPRQWAHYQNQVAGQEQIIGTPIEQWPLITRSQAEELKGIPKNASLFTRTFTAITYLNDDYEGGETVVCEKTLAPWNLAKQLISKPKKGSVIIYHSACFHKVNEIQDADRFTLAMFFCKDYEHSHWKSIGKEPQ